MSDRPQTFWILVEAATQQEFQLSAPDGWLNLECNVCHRLPVTWRSACDRLAEIHAKEGYYSKYQSISIWDTD